MKYSDIKELCRHGKVGRIPGWVGYLKWDYGTDQIYFINGDYKMTQSELEDKIADRTDLYYII